MRAISPRKSTYTRSPFEHWNMDLSKLFVLKAGGIWSLDILCAPHNLSCPENSRHWNYNEIKSSVSGTAFISQVMTECALFSANYFPILRIQGDSLLCVLLQVQRICLPGFGEMQVLKRNFEPSHYSRSSPKMSESVLHIILTPLLVKWEPWCMRKIVFVKCHLWIRPSSHLYCEYLRMCQKYHTRHASNFRRSSKSSSNLPLRPHAGLCWSLVQVSQLIAL